jgi:hypothetical protein
MTTGELDRDGRLYSVAARSYAPSLFFSVEGRSRSSVFGWLHLRDENSDPMEYSYECGSVRQSVSCREQAEPSVCHQVSS